MCKKKCSKCQEIFDYSFFKPRKEGKLKLESRCNECLRISYLNKKYKKPEFLDNEIWKDIPGYEALYQASNLGRVMSLDKEIINKNGKSKIQRAIILKQTIDKGYKAINLSVNYKKLRTGAHRLVALAFIPNPENKPCVNHINGIKDDNRVENLEWVTYSENERHSIDVLKKRIRIGEKSPSSKLTEKDVLAIRRLYRINPKFNRKIVAKKFNMHPNSLNDITRRKSWTHI